MQKMLLNLNKLKLLLNQFCSLQVILIQDITRQFLFRVTLCGSNSSINSFIPKLCLFCIVRKERKLQLITEERSILADKRWGSWAPGLNVWDSWDSELTKRTPQAMRRNVQLLCRIARGDCHFTETVTTAEYTRVIIRDLQSAYKNNAQQSVPPNPPLEVLQRMHTFERSFPQTTLTLYILSTPPFQFLTSVTLLKAKNHTNSLLTVQESYYCLKVKRHLTL